MSPDTYNSSNYSKHVHPNPVQRWLIRRFHHSALKLLDQVEIETALDAGCGEGFAMQAVLKQRTKVRLTGVDASLPALAIARQVHRDVAFVGADLSALPFAGKSFDVVVCTEVLEHLTSPAEGLRELQRVARKYLLLSVPNEPFFRIANFLRGKNLIRWGNDIGHIQHWTTKSFMKFVKSENCKVIAWRTSFPWILVLCLHE